MATDKSPLEQLISNHRRNGYVLFDDLLPVISKSAAAPEIDFVFTTLASEGIDIRHNAAGDFWFDAAPMDALNVGVYTDDPVRVYLREVGQIPLLTSFEENEIVERIKAGNESAWKDLVEAHLRLVVYIAKRYEARGIHILDLIQAGNIGLMESSKTFQELRRYRFATWAGWFVRHAIIEMIENPPADAVISIHRRNK